MLLGGGATVRAAEPILIRDDDPRRLAAPTGVDGFTESALLPRLRARDALLDDLGGERDAVRLRPRLDVAALLFDRDRAFLRSALAHVRDERSSCGGSYLFEFTSDASEDTAKGNRPSFSHAAPPERAEALYEAFCDALEAEGVRVGRGVFGARMEVELLNDGPVTIVL